VFGLLGQEEQRTRNEEQERRRKKGKKKEEGRVMRFSLKGRNRFYRLGRVSHRVSHRAIMTVMSHDAESSNEMMTFDDIFINL
jgi:hypothetical protein